MRERCEPGKFWILYAAKRFALDIAFRQKLDKIFFGLDSNWETKWEDRIKLLSEEEQVELNWREPDILGVDYRTQVAR
jgi:hypothetical protein